MNQNKLTIDLRRVPLTDKQLKEVHNAIHKAVASQLDKIEKAKEKAAAKKPRSKAKKATKSKKAAADLESFASMAEAAPVAVATKTANINVKFTNTIPGKSELTAILKGNRKTLTQSGTITFTGVNSNDMILIQNTSLGTTTVTIDISADPTQMNFGPGSGNDQFFIN